MSIITTEGILLSDEEVAAFVPSKSDEEMARHYAELINDIYLHADDLDEKNCPPDRRFYHTGKEAWVYDHGNIAELVYVNRD